MKKIWNLEFGIWNLIAGILMPVFLLSFFPAAKAREVKSIQALAITASDPFFSNDPVAIDKQWYLAKTKTVDAWDYTKGSANVIVAVIDTGIHASHIELNDGRVMGGYNTITNLPIKADSNSDDNGHGTAVAGILGAIANNAQGLAGINWNIRIMPIKALSADGIGETSDVAEGIVWAADNGANIINLSLGGNGLRLDRALSDAVSYAYNRGVLIVAAAGNDSAEQGLNLDQSATYPICADNGMDMVLGVTATDINDIKADFSNFGANCVDISAPGKKILTTAYFPADPSNNILIYGSGTSLAAPIVSGIAALVKSFYPNYSNVDLANALKKNADKIDFLNQTNCLGSSCNGFLGKGRVNALNAIVPKPINEGTLVRSALDGSIYLIVGTTKRLVSPFVANLRGLNLANAQNEINNQLSQFTAISPLPPPEGTLVKSADSPLVYLIDKEMKRPLTYLVFISRGLKFSDIKITFKSEIDSYVLGEWYEPPEGTTVLIKGNPTVYVMDSGVRRPVTFFVFNQRNLSFAKVIQVTADEFAHIPAPPDPYWLAPLDQTLVRAENNPAVYLIENQIKMLLSYSAFISRGYRFGSVKTLPQGEVDVIAPGSPIL